MKPKTVVLTLGCLMSLICAQSRAATVNDYASTADTIVIGRVTDRFEGPSGASFDIAVEKILKGSLPGQSVHVSHSWPRTGGIIIGDIPRRVNGQIRGIWFLQHTASSDWDALVARSFPGVIGSIYWPVVETLPAEYRYAADASLADVLTFEFAAGLEVAGNPTEMIGATGPLNTPALQSVFAHWLGSQKVAFQAAGLAGMLNGGQQDAIPQLARLWPTIAADQSRHYVLSALRNSFRDSTPSSVQQLAKLADASATSTELRKAAIWALASIHTSESLPFLATLLMSSDPGEQGRGVSGLSSFANGCPSQTPENVKSLDYLQFKNPSPYRNAETMANFAIPVNNLPGDPKLLQLVSFWTAWWEQHPELH